MKLSTALLARALLTAAVPASAQSLGELAKKEAERRKATPPAAKTYTNGDLKQVPPPTGTPGKPAEDASRSPPRRSLARRSRRAAEGRRDQTARTGEGRSLLARRGSRRRASRAAQRSLQGSAAVADQRADRGVHRARRSLSSARRWPTIARRRSPRWTRVKSEDIDKSKKLIARHRGRSAPRRRSSRLDPLKAQILIVEDKDSLRDDAAARAGAAGSLRPRSARPAGSGAPAPAGAAGRRPVRPAAARRGRVRRAARRQGNRRRHPRHRHDRLRQHRGCGLGDEGGGDGLSREARRSRSPAAARRRARSSSAAS